LQTPPWHWFERVVSQAMHAAPPVPHWLCEGVVHVCPLQHPVLHVIEQPAHVPFTHDCAPQLVHAVPPWPHCALVLVTHVLPLQQPAHPELVSHVHVPFTQRRPAPQAAPLVPQEQTPLKQVSVFWRSHVPHAPLPATPHAPVVWVATLTQTFPLQQPPGHDEALHTQTPDELHTWPAAHGALPPQRHRPPVHALALLPQPTHALPPLPHCESDGVVQVRPAQQPLGQLAESHAHALPVQCWLAGHAGPVPHPQLPSLRHALLVSIEHEAQAPPLLPHAPVECGLHVVPLQQPLGQLVAVQRHWPSTHSWPSPHGGLVPHRHWPLVHAGALRGSHAAQSVDVPHCELDCIPVVMHVPLLQQPAQLDGSHPTHCPASQPLGQVLQSTPPVPQALLLWSVRQTWVTGSQQPDGQLAAEHSQFPFTQRWPA
jgi:hypothetical protein